MITIQLNGTYKLDKDTRLKDPLVTLLRAYYNYEAMTVVIVCSFENNQYRHIRELDPAVITDTDGLTTEEITTIVNANLTLKKQ